VTVSEPADIAARRHIASAFDVTLFASAGAGTGKTTALVDRLVNALLAGHATIGEVAVVTFTEAAAGELRVRLRTALRAAAAGQPWRDGAPLPPVDPAVATSRAQQALAGVEDATVTTLHGFARAILFAHPLAAGIPPVCTVLDESAAATVVEAEWQTAAAELFADPDWAEVVGRAAIVGIDVPALGVLYRRLTENWDRLDHLVASAPRQPGPMEAIAVDAVLDPLQAAMDEAVTCTDHTDLLYRHLLRLSPFVERLRAAADDTLRLIELQEAPALSCTRGRRANWPGLGVADVRQRCADAEAARQAILADVGQRCLAVLGHWLAQQAVAAAEARATRGELTFHDLLALARRSLAEHPEVAAALGRRWRLLFLDELQDTDPVQAELAMRIAAGRPPDGRPWAELSAEPGRLFLVGDTKQAIYRFRRADIAVVDELCRAAGGQQVELTDNWRSVPGIIAWVNTVVGGLFGAGTPGVQPPYQTLVARRSPMPLGRPPVVVLGGPDPERRTAPERRALAMADVAAVIGAAVGRWPVGEGRPASLADICVLLPTRTGLRQLEAALDEQDIAYRLDSGSLVYASSQVRDVLAVLRAVDDPVDPVNLVAALRTPLLACGDADLASYRAAGGRWQLDGPRPDAVAADHPVCEALDLIAELRRQRWWRDPASLVDAVIERTGAVTVALGARRWREAWRRLRFLQAEARTFTDQLGGDLRQFLAWTACRSDEHVRTGDADLVDGDGAVHVMTIHGAKGLEFPICVLAGWDSRPPRRPAVDVLFDGDRPELRAHGVRTAGYERLDQQARLCDEAERVRLLYVAATRARDHLVVAVHHDPQHDSLARTLHQACLGAPDLWATLDDVIAGPPCGATGAGSAPSDPVAPDPVAPDPVAPDPVAPDSGAPDSGAPGSAASASVPGSAAALDADAQAVATGDPSAVAAAEAAWHRRRAALVDDAQRPAVVTASAVASALGAPAGRRQPHQTEDDTATGVGDDGDALDDDGDVGASRRGRGATAVGRAVHATLQVVDLVSGAHLAAIAASAAVTEGVPDMAGTVAQLARAALHSDVVRRAADHGRLWREVYVGAPVGGRLVEGIVDLLIDEGDGLHVVDYKTDLLPDDQAIDLAVERHRHQVATYALLVGTATGRPVTGCTLLFLRAGHRPDGDGGRPAANGRSAGRRHLPVGQAVARSLVGDELQRTIDDVRRWLVAGADLTAPCPG